MCVDDNGEMDYFINALRFFNNVQWMYNIPVTEILVEKCVNKFPKEWLEVLEKLNNDELNNFVVHRLYNNDWPDSLKHFLETCKVLNTLPNINTSLSSLLPSAFLKGLNPKKRHEIQHVAHLVHSQCLERKITRIVDFGAGLGYVSQLMYHLYGYQVLGLEANSKNVETAKHRQQKFFPDSINSVKYVCYKLTSDSTATIVKLLQETFENQQNVCLIGLHACGDLSTDMFKIFSNLEFVTIIILMSCCYHKMSIKIMTDAKSEYFNNFPMSHVFQQAIQKSKLDNGNFLKRTFLRLACQESADRWQEMSEQAHNEHSFHVLARAVIELYATQNGLLLQKLVRKGTRKSQCNDFQTYLKDAMQRYVYKKILDPGIEVTINEKELQENLTTLWNENSSKLKAVEIYTALQMLLQGPAESIVLNDRLCWLKEHNFDTKIVPIFSRKLSPRCYAIVSWRK